MYLCNLRDARVQAGLSQAELSRRSRVGRDAISRYESLQRQAQTATVERLAAVLEVDPEMLYGEQPDPAPPIFRELRDRLREADARGGRAEQIEELERYLERHPGRLRAWLYETTIEELTARSSLSAGEYGEAARGAGRAAGKALELYPVLALVILELVQDLLERPYRPALPPSQTSETAPETTTEPVPAARPPRASQSRVEAAEPDEED